MQESKGPEKKSTQQYRHGRFAPTAVGHTLTHVPTLSLTHMTPRLLWFLVGATVHHAYVVSAANNGRKTSMTGRTTGTTGWLPARSHGNNSGRDAGILYEVWHTPAAHLMHLQAKAGSPQLTVEKVIQSSGNLTLDDVFRGAGVPPGFTPDIYNVEPTLGTSCLFVDGRCHQGSDSWCCVG